MINAARQRDIPVVVDPKGADYTRYSGASIVTPNLKEFQQAGGETESEETIRISAQRLLEQFNLDELLVTRSEKGMSWFSRQGEELHDQAVSQEVFDVSGAGDTVAAVLSVGMAANHLNNMELYLLATEKTLLMSLSNQRTSIKRKKEIVF